MSDSTSPSAAGDGNPVWRQGYDQGLRAGAKRASDIADQHIQALGSNPDRSLIMNAVMAIQNGVLSMASLPAVTDTDPVVAAPPEPGSTEDQQAPE